MARILAGLLCFTVALGWCVATAQAATFVPEESTLTLCPFGSSSVIGPFTALPGTEGMVVLSDSGVSGHDVTIDSGVFSTVYGADTSIFTGVPLFTSIWGSVANAPGTFTSGFTHVNYVGDNSVVGPYLGGEMPLSGEMVLSILKGVVMVTFDLAPVGGPAGGVQSLTILGVPIRVTYAPWVTGAVPVTGITTHVVSLNGVTGAGITLRLTSLQHPPVLSTGGGYVVTGGGLPMEYHTVTLHGENDLLSESRDGTVTLVSPMRIDTSPAISGRLPGAAWMDLTFVPEPGTMLLLVSGAIGLAVMGRRQMRK